MNFCRPRNFLNYSTILLLITLFEEILAVNTCIRGTSKVTNDLLQQGMNVSKKKFSLISHTFLKFFYLTNYLYCYETNSQISVI